MATRKVKPETENLSSAIDSILRERKMNRNALLNAIEAAPWKKRGRSTRGMAWATGFPWWSTRAILAASPRKRRSR